MKCSSSNVDHSNIVMKHQNTVQKYVRLSGWAFCGLVVVFGVGAQITQAAWNPPSAQAPAGNVYAPLNTSDDFQAKKGRLLLDPFYNPYGALPNFDYQLTVRGTRDTYINDLLVSPQGTLGVDTDTLYVDGTTHRIGVRTQSPDTLLEVAGGVLVGEDGVGVLNSAIVTSSELFYGAVGESHADSIASVLGRGIGMGSIGVYGLHTGNGAGIQASSLTGSALVGSSSGVIDRTPGATKVAGIYAQAKGLGAWAGYFTKQVVGSDEIAARSFIPSRLGQSPYPYTVGWEMQQINESYLANPRLILYDGAWIWMMLPDFSPNFYLIDPSNGAVSEEFVLRDGSGTTATGVTDMILAGGYIWTANSRNDGWGVSRVDPADPTHTATHFEIGTNPGFSNDGAYRIAYDDYTTGGPYIWSVNGPYSGTFAYSISRLRPSDGTYVNFQLNPDAGQSCLSVDMNLCNDGLDNDGDGLIDMGVCSNPAYSNEVNCVANGGTWTSGDPECLNNTGVNPMGTGTCTNPSYLDYTACMNNGGTWIPADERLTLREPNSPEGISVEFNPSDPNNPHIWISFSGLVASNPRQYAGEAIARVDGADPTNTATQRVYCPGPSTEPHGISHAGGYVWFAKNAHFSKYQGNEGMGRLDPATGTFNHFYSPGVMNRIKLDDQTTGGPFIWGQAPEALIKYNMAGAVVQAYQTPAGTTDFTFDRTSGSVDYIWGAHESSSLISRNTTAVPYGSVTYIPKGSYSYDIVFDGANIWSSNRAGNTVSKYRASDGKKIGDYLVNWSPESLVFDGSSIWVTHAEVDGFDLAQLNAADGILIGDYHYKTGGAQGGVDMTYDGRYLWVTDDITSLVWRIDTQTCVAGNCNATSYSVPGRPYYITYDGEHIWVTLRDRINEFAKINPITGDVEVTHTIPGAYTTTNNLSSMTFDGTYLWFGSLYRDNEGNSIYKVRPSTGELVDAITVYNEPGVCNGGSRNNLYCTANTQCPNGGSCSATRSNIRDLIFDGTHIWSVNEYSSSTRECNDGIDNDGDGLIDAGPGGDPDCEDSWDGHELNSAAVFGTTLDNECSDGIDNNGDGLCDYDGAVGSPGCSGKPDPNCSSPTDISEIHRTSGSFLSRINAGTGEFIESINYGNICEPTSLAFDGSAIWINQYAQPCTSHVLHKYFAGQGSGTNDYEGLVALQSTVPGRVQTGNVSTYGGVRIGRKLFIGDDLQVTQNTWGGSADSVTGLGASCPDGEFLKGIDIMNKQLHCRPL